MPMAKGLVHFLAFKRKKITEPLKSLTPILFGGAPKLYFNHPLSVYFAKQRAYFFLSFLGLEVLLAQKTP
jgi:uncharacterized membrane protein